MSQFPVLLLRAAVLMLMTTHAAGAQPTSSKAAPPPIIELRLASSSRASGFTLRRELPSGDQPRVLFLAAGTVVADADLVRARTRPAPDGIVVEIVLSDAGATRLREATARNIGKYMAILAHGRFAGSAIIMASIPRGNRVSIGLTLPPAAADSVRSHVAARWPGPGQ